MRVLDGDPGLADAAEAVNGLGGGDGGGAGASALSESFAEVGEERVPPFEVVADGSGDVGDEAGRDAGDDLVQVSDELAEEIGGVLELAAVALGQAKFQPCQMRWLGTGKVIEADGPVVVNGDEGLPLGVGEVSEVA